MQTARYDSVVRYDVGDGEHDFGVYGVLVSVVFFAALVMWLLGRGANLQSPVRRTVFTLPAKWLWRTFVSAGEGHAIFNSLIQRLA